jgi:hypothetical protein
MPQSQTKEVKQYYVELPKHQVYVKENSANEIVFTKFMDNATVFSKDSAIRLAKEYDLDVLERTITITTNTVDTILKL